MKNSNFKISIYGIRKYTMLLSLKSIFLILILILTVSWKKSNKQPISLESTPPIGKVDSSNHKPLILAVERLDLYFDSLVGKRVAIVGNQTSLIGKTHLVDTLVSL